MRLEKKVKGFAKESDNTMSPGRARSGDERSEFP